MHFCSEYSRARQSTASRVHHSFHNAPCDHLPISCARLAVAVAAPAIGLFVARCALVRNYRQAICSEL